MDTFKELEKIRIKYGGLLRPEDVVAEAKRQEHPLHNKFIWDDTIAGQRYRIWQARELIRVSVTIIESVSTEPIKAYWSYQDNRNGKNGGGYTAMVEILGDKERYALMLDEAKKELSAFQKKFKHLKELGRVFFEIDAILNGSRYNEKDISKSFAAKGEV